MREMGGEGCGRWEVRGVKEMGGEGCEEMGGEGYVGDGR